MVASPPGLQSREGRPNSSYPNNSRAVNVFFEMDNYSRSGGRATGTPGVRPAYPGPHGDITSTPLPEESLFVDESQLVGRVVSTEASSAALMYSSDGSASHGSPSLKRSVRRR